MYHSDAHQSCNVCCTYTWTLYFGVRNQGVSDNIETEGTDRSPIAVCPDRARANFQGQLALTPHQIFMRACLAFKHSLMRDAARTQEPNYKLQQKANLGHPIRGTSHDARMISLPPSHSPPSSYKKTLPPFALCVLLTVSVAIHIFFLVFSFPKPQLISRGWAQSRGRSPSARTMICMSKMRSFLRHLPSAARNWLVLGYYLYAQI
jgi:hypothetical protein